MKKKLILVAAPPACGKTYVSKQIAKALEQVVYLDKDDLRDLLRASFAVGREPLNMDGDFYIQNLRGPEYSTIIHLAFSTLRFSPYVILNAPFGKEVRDVAYMKALKEKANQMDAQLFLIWVTAPLSVCHERMKKRNSDRDLLKLENWEDYVSKINYQPPYALANAEAVDSLYVFDTKDDATFQHALNEVMKMITGGSLC